MVISRAEGAPCPVQHTHVLSSDLALGGVPAQRHEGLLWVMSRSADDSAPMSAVGRKADMIR